MSISQMTTATEDRPGELTIESLYTSDNSATERRLAAALAEHQHHISDMSRLSVSPLSSREVMDRVEETGYVSAYVPIQLSELAVNTEELVDFLAARLCVDPVERLEYEGVWTLGDVVVLYVRADLA